MIGHITEAKKRIICFNLENAFRMCVKRAQNDKTYYREGDPVEAIRQKDGSYMIVRRLNND